MAVVRTHGNTHPASLLDLKQCLHHAVHIHVALKQVRLIEITLGITFGRAQMDETDPVAELPHHGHTVVIRPNSERTGAEAQPVRSVRNSGNQFPEILRSGEDAWQSEQRVRRVIGMDDHHGAALVSYRADLLQEKYEVLAQLLFCHPVIAGQRLTELLKSEAFLTSRQTGNHIPCNQLNLGLIHLLVTGLRHRNLLLSPLVESRLSAEYEKIERHERRLLEPQRTRAVRHLELEIGPRPVDNRHEVVGYDVNSALGEITYALLVVLYIFEVFPLASLYVLMHGHTLNNAPFKPRLSDEFLPFSDFLDGPDFSVRDMMQGMDDVGHSSLPDIAQAHGVIRSIPPPAFSHSNHH